MWVKLKSNNKLLFRHDIWKEKIQGNLGNIDKSPGCHDASPHDGHVPVDHASVQRLCASNVVFLISDCFLGSSYTMPALSLLRIQLH